MGEGGRLHSACFSGHLCEVLAHRAHVLVVDLVVNYGSIVFQEVVEKSMRMCFGLVLSCLELFVDKVLLVGCTCRVVGCVCCCLSYLCLSYLSVVKALLLVFAPLVVVIVALVVVEGGLVGVVACASLDLVLRLGLVLSLGLVLRLSLVVHLGLAVLDLVDETTRWLYLT